jgi:hypothetical protein
MNTCEKCGTPLPGLAPGYVIVTCRQCGATYHLRADGRLRDSQGPLASARGPGIAAPPQLIVEEPGEGVLRIGWRYLSLERLLLVPAVLVAGGVFALLHPDDIAVFGPFEWSLFGAGLVAACYPAIVSLVNVTWLELRDHTLRWSSKPLPLRGSVSLDVRLLRSVYVHTSTERRHKGYFTATRYAVLAQDPHGYTVPLAVGLEDERTARWLAETLRTRLGLEDGPLDATGR